MVANGPRGKIYNGANSDLCIMHFSIHIPNFVLLSQSAQLLLIFAMPPH